MGIEGCPQCHPPRNKALLVSRTGSVVYSVWDTSYIFLLNTEYKILCVFALLKTIEKLFDTLTYFWEKNALAGIPGIIKCLR